MPNGLGCRRRRCAVIPAVKIFMPAGAEAPVCASYTEHYPPDTQAASLWLRNRQPAKWRDRGIRTCSRRSLSECVSPA